MIHHPNVVYHYNRLQFDKICFNAADLAVTYNQTKSDDFFGQFANGTDLDYLWVLIAGALVFCMYFYVFLFLFNAILMNMLIFKQQ